MPRSVPLLAGLAVLMLGGLTGCDLLVAGRFMPAIGPGIGDPIEGTVVDSLTRLPIGGATVTSGLGSTITDASGHFKLYGNLSSRQISVSRAGYTALTLGGVDLSSTGEIEFPLDPQFPNTASLPQRFLDLRGGAFDPITFQPMADGVVCYGGQLPVQVSNGQYDVTVQAGSPGKQLTTVLAWGRTSNQYVAGSPFFFLNFAYRLDTWPLADTVPQGRLSQDLKANMPGFGVIQPSPIQVRYTNLGRLTNVQTDVLLDFGVAGSVLVAHATGSNQSIPVPQIAGMKYDVSGVAQDDSGLKSSSVTLTTNDPSKAPFQLLSLPTIDSPTSGAAGVGQRPSFSWEPLPGNGLTYEITLFEGDKDKTTFDGRPKWVARTSDTEVDYPNFALNDVNGAALRPDKKYTWTLRVVDVLGATENPSTTRDLPPVRPYRVRERECEIRGNTFTL